MEERSRSAYTFQFAILQLITSSLEVVGEMTTWTTCNCFAGLATVSKATALKNTYSLECELTLN